MTRSEFERAFAELLRRQGADLGNPGSVACEDCRRCTACTFCRASTDLLRCHYCVGCERSVDCTHCHGSRDLIGCNHCERSERCVGSAYLGNCVDCRDCHYCFGCVGLAGAEFHVLNQRYDRSAYFALVAELRRELAGEPVRAVARR
ncbi:MAG: hypothetical protein HY908_00210 [Myxococcales bacterium]|nr:hypothetical protein [Myxococcales bacterium]